MLVLNIWEGSDKWSLMNGSNVYGHAAMTIPAQGSATEACYISWWPGGENSTQVKDGKGKSTDRDKDRSFNEDLFAENNHRYLGQLVFTLPLSVGADLDEFWSTSRRQAAGSTIFPKDIQDMFGSKGHPVGDKTLLGALVPNEHWVLDDPEAKKAYLVYKGKKELKVTALEGHRFLFELETKDPIDWIPDQKTRIAKTFPPSLAALLKQKVSALVIDPDAYVGRMSADQVFVSTKKSDGYVSVTPGTGGKKVIRYYHWTRQNLAPTANIEIPTISDGGKGLDDIAIRRWWNIFNAQDHPKWSTFERNCSVIVMIALKILSAHELAESDFFKNSLVGATAASPRAVMRSKVCSFSSWSVVCGSTLMVKR